ncbi:Rpn family recombination-promoting nuclease/putative transposase [Iningainema tapete]|uniref:Rpn family recombination-promoting nuclease/putative transposase n=1 Tax=Iningainema tapete TaxID=2806730 RepID=UPI0030800FA9
MIRTAYHHIYGRTRIDGVFLPKLENENTTYFVEVQFQSDDEMYSRLFSEVCLYLRQNQPKNNWRAVVIHPTRSLDTGDIKHYQEYFASGRVSRIYIDELGEAESLPVGIATIKLVIENENTAIEKARQLINRTRQQIESPAQQRQLLELVETILVYKFLNMSREEIAAMFKISDIKQSRFYQEALKEARPEVRQEVEQEVRREVTQQVTQQVKLEAVPKFLALGLTVEQVAQALELSVEQVRLAAQN